MPRFGLTSEGFLVDGENFLVFSPRLGKFVQCSFAVADILDATVISDEEAQKLIKARTTREPVGVVGEDKREPSERG